MSQERVEEIKRIQAELELELASYTPVSTEILTPIINRKYVLNNKWNYDLLEKDFHKLNGRYIPLDAIKKITKRLRINRLPQLDVPIKELQLLNPLGLEDVFKTIKGCWYYNTEIPARQLAMHLFLGKKNVLEEGQSCTRWFPKNTLREVINIDRDPLPFSDTNLNINGMPDLDTSFPCEPTQECLDILKTGLGKRHLVTASNYYNYDLIQLELFIQTGINYRPSVKELQPKHLIGI